MNLETSQTELEVVNMIIRELSHFGKDIQARLVQTVATFLKVDISGSPASPGATAPYPHRLKETESSASGVGFSEREDLSPKDFLLEKEPRTNHERVACLGYYLAHFRDTPHFKTLDISKLNTEAAQAKFTNAAVAVKEATRRGVLVPAGKGKKQLSALAEQYVQALPDTEAAKKILKRIKPARKKAASAKEGQTRARSERKPLGKSKL